MTLKERVEVLEREIADLRLLVEAYRAMQPIQPYIPAPAPYPWYPNSGPKLPTVTYLHAVS
jgi:hypothetical protein